MKSKCVHMTLHVAWLEAKLLLRNQATRRQLTMGGVMATMAAGYVFLLYPEGTPDSWFATMSIYLMYMATIFLPFNYAMLAFSWNATNAASLFDMPIASEHQLLGRIVVTVILAALSVVLLTLSSAFLNPRLTLFPLTSGLLFVTVFTLPTFLVSAWAVRRRMDAHAPPLSNLNLYRWPHYLQGLLVIGFGMGMSRTFSYETCLVVSAIVALCGLATLPLAIRYAAGMLTKNIPRMSTRLLEG